MEINKSKTIEINWLGNCPTCDREEHMVSTSEGNKDYLYEDDIVKCRCGQTGVIETDGEGHAWCTWDKKAATEWDNFNLYYRQKYPEYWDLLPKANHQACTHHEELFNSWVEAKSQAVPELVELQERIAGHQYYHDEHGHMIVDMDDVVKEISGFDSWKSQAVPEGFVLINAESLALHAQSIRMFNNSEEEEDYFEIENHVCAIEAMIEKAQEQSHDSKN